MYTEIQQSENQKTKRQEESDRERDIKKKLK